MLSVECCVRSLCNWGCRGLSCVSLLDAALRVGHVRKCVGFSFQVYNCVQGGVGDFQEREVFSPCCRVVFEATLLVQVVVSDERTSCEHAAVALHFGVLCVSVRPGRFVAPVSFQLSLHVFCVNVAMSR